MSVYITTWKLSKQQVTPVTTLLQDLAVVRLKFTFHVNMAVGVVIRSSSTALHEINC